MVPYHRDMDQHNISYCHEKTEEFCQDKNKKRLEAHSVKQPMYPRLEGEDDTVGSDNSRKARWGCRH